jgi:hypothetical protein
METFEGLWTVYVQSNFQTIGSGVAVVIRDRILGGDGFYYYDGNLKVQGNTAEATIRIVRFNQAGMGIFGNLDSYTLRVSGDVSASPIELHGNMVEQPNMKITMKCQKITSL